MKCGDPSNPGGIGRKSNGDPCGNEVAHGTNRCYMHGGNLPAAKIKAETTMALLRMPAIEALHNVITSLHQRLEQFDAATCAACGQPDGSTDYLAKLCRSLAMTCTSVLDRTGLGPHAVLEIKQSDGDLDPKLLTDDEKGRMLALIAQMRGLKEEIRLRLHGRATGVEHPAEQLPARLM